MEYEIRDYGIDHDQYFPGVGVAFTEWDACYVGVGGTLREAIDDAIENAAQAGVETFDIEDCTGPDFPYTPDQLDAPLHDESDECSADDEGCSHHHYAVLFVKEAA